MTLEDQELHNLVCIFVDAIKCTVCGDIYIKINGIGYCDRCASTEGTIVASEYGSYGVNILRRASIDQMKKRGM